MEENTDFSEMTSVTNNTNRILKNHGVTSDSIGVNNKLTKEEKGKFVQEFIKQLFQKLEEEKILVVDRFEGNIVVCENRESGEMVNIEEDKLPENIKEGDVLKYKNGQYSIDYEERAAIEERINDKLKNLFND